MPDVLRVLGAHLIAWHHLCTYGALPRWLQSLWPALVSALYNEARMAVQIFLVLSGFLGARALLPLLEQGQPAWRLWPVLGWQRFVRLVQLYWPVLVLTLLASVLVRPLLEDGLVPDAPDALGLLSHAVLLHGVLEQASLSAGVWYVAIDMQLFAVLLLLTALASRAGRGQRVALYCGLLCAGVAASALVFNRHPELDNWALYFFGAYGLGALTWLAGRSRLAQGALALALGLSAWALWLEPRPRLALAMLSALLLGLSAHWTAKRPQQTSDQTPGAPPQRALRLLFRLSDASYALFLSNFLVVLLANACWAWSGWQGEGAALAVLLLAWALNMALADFLHHRLEKTMLLQRALRRLWSLWHT